MANLKWPTHQVCVTCQHWSGPRDVTPARDLIQFYHEGDRGICRSGGARDRQETPVLGGCNDWTKWSVVR